MSTTRHLTKVIEELSDSIKLISEKESESLVNEILKAKKIFVTGAGRSGLMGKAFAMRMMHMGFDAHVIGETTTPNFTDEDLLIIGTGSGETRTLVPIAQKAKELGGKIADLIVKLPGARKDLEGSYNTIQPMGSLFEQTMLLFYDATILSLMEKRNLNSGKMYGKHANLE